MLFFILKSYARVCLWLYCRNVVVNKPELLQARGPILFAANHPNSFLDGMLLTTLMDAHLYSLARGDAFTRRWNGLLRWLHLLPVYRTSEGAANLTHNYTTFAACRRVFEAGGAVLIFSEGLCKNEWLLRPLRKGTARLAIGTWEQGLPLTVVPLGFNYSSFDCYGKTVHLKFGQPLDKTPVLAHLQDGKQFAYFNQQLAGQLTELVYEINPHDKTTRRRIFETGRPPWQRFLLALPAAAGWLLHAPLYYPVKWSTRFFEKEHFDSIIAGMLLLFYPVYLALLTAVVCLQTGPAGLLLLLLLPLCARALVLWKPAVC